MKRRQVAAAITGVVAGVLLGVVPPAEVFAGPNERDPAATITLPAPGVTMPLYDGCNTVALTFPDGTASATVTEAIEPAAAAGSIWRHRVAQDSYAAFSATAPQASDLATVNFLDPVWLCLAGEPALGGPPVPPNRFYCLDPGCVTLNGAPAPPGTGVLAIIGDNVCGQTTVMADSTYVLDVVSEGQTAGCGTEGASVSITGSPEGSAFWHSGDFTELDLAASYPVPPNRFYCLDPGCVTLDGSPAPPGTNVSAIIDGNVCGQTVVMADSTYVLDVVSEGQTAGCGTEGASVNFSVGGGPAERAFWHSGDFTELVLAASSPPVPPNRFYCLDPGCVTLNGSPAPPGTNVTASIGDNVCGQTVVMADSTYVLDVVSGGQTAGCGTEGASVRFTVAGNPAGGATWQSGYFTFLDLPAPAVGGIAELPALAGTSAEEAGASAGRSGWSAGGYAALAGGLAAAVLAVTASAWYVRRRWLR